MSISRVLEYYGGDVPDGYGWKKMRCCFHDDSIASAVVNVEEGVYKCFACDAKGDCLSLIMYREGVDYASSKRLYKTITGGDYSGVSESASIWGVGSGGKVSPGKRDYERGSGLFPPWFLP